MSKSNSDVFKKYDDKFIESISLNNIKDSKELKDLLDRLEAACNEINEHYVVRYKQFIDSINSSRRLGIPEELSFESMRKTKQLVRRIHRARNYVLYMYTFENPFKTTVRG